MSQCVRRTTLGKCGDTNLGCHGSGVNLASLYGCGFCHNLPFLMSVKPPG